MAAFRFFQWTLLNGNAVSENVLNWQGAVEFFCTMVFCQDTLVKVKAKAVELRFQLAKLAKLQLPRAWPSCFSRCQRFWLGRCSKETTRDENGVCCKSSRGEATENLLHETGAKSTCFCVCQHHVQVVDEVASLSGLVMFPFPGGLDETHTAISRAAPDGMEVYFGACPHHLLIHFWTCLGYWIPCLTILTTRYFLGSQRTVLSVF